jgi:hypothetical protein
MRQFNMKINPGKLMLGLLAIFPVMIALWVLSYAVVFAVLGFQPGPWVLVLVSGALIVSASVILRCAYLAWRRPSAATVRDVCDWTGLAIGGTGLAAFFHQFDSGPVWLAWVELAALIGFVWAFARIERWLIRSILRNTHGLGRPETSNFQRSA